jgi:hypothetical protein
VPVQAPGQGLAGAHPRLRRGHHQDLVRHLVRLQRWRHSLHAGGSGSGGGQGGPGAGG